MGFSITDAAFEGYRVLKRTPLSVLAWGVAFILAIAVTMALAGGSAFAILGSLGDFAEHEQPSPQALGALGTIYLIAIPFFLMAFAIVAAAACRAVLRPSQPGLAYLRLGGAELKLVAAYLVLIVGAIVGVLVLVLLVGLLAGGGAMAAAAAGQGASTGIAAVGLLYPVMFSILFLVIWLSVRLSLIAPISVAENSFAIGRSWAATKGRFWMLLDLIVASNVRWFVAYAVVISVVSALAMFGLGLSGQAEALASSGDALSGMMIGLLALWAVLCGLIVAVQVAVTTCPLAVFYRDVVAPPVTSEPESVA